MSVVMYVKDGCPYCEKARQHYRAGGIEFTEYDAEADPQRKQEMLEFSGGDLTVPAIVINGEYVQSGWGTPPRG